MICKGYLIGCGRFAEVIDIKNYSRTPQHALETIGDFTTLRNELTYGEE